MALPPSTDVVSVQGVICKPLPRRSVIVMAAKAFQPGATARKIVRSAKECGFEITALNFGISVLDVCFLIANQPRRRSKGLSSANLRNMNRSLRQISRARKNAKEALGRH